MLKESDLRVVGRFLTCTLRMGLTPWWGVAEVFLLLTTHDLAAGERLPV